MLQTGNKAPDFTLYATPYEEISLYDFQGKRVVLVFYPADWSPVCGDQLMLYNEITDVFDKMNTQVIGISVDSKWCHASYREQRNLGFPLLADFEPKGSIARMYGVYNEQEGECERALFVLDEKSIIQWSFLSEPDKNPGVEGILNALEKLEPVS
ncbi:MAG TPA: redoxin domain-containing protein [Chitinophagaceae bacterium]